MNSSKDAITSTNFEVDEPAPLFHAACAVQADALGLTPTDMDMSTEMSGWIGDLYFPDGFVTEMGTGGRLNDECNRYAENVMRVLLAGDWAFSTAPRVRFPERAVMWARTVTMEAAGRLWPDQREAVSRVHLMMTDAARFVHRNKRRINELACQLVFSDTMTVEAQAAFLTSLDDIGRPKKPAKSSRSKAGSLS